MHLPIVGVVDAFGKCSTCASRDDRDFAIPQFRDAFRGQRIPRQRIPRTVYLFDMNYGDRCNDPQLAIRPFLHPRDLPPSRKPAPFDRLRTCFDPADPRARLTCPTPARPRLQSVPQGNTSL